MSDTTIRIESLLQHDRFARALASGLLADEHAAEDLAQEAWVRVLQGRARSVLDLRAWLASVLRNLERNRERDERRRSVHERAAARPEAMPSVAELAERESVRQELVRAVFELPEPHRGLVLLRYYEGRSAADIARSRGRAASTVRVQLRESMAMLRSRLDERHGGRREAWAVPLAGWLRPSAVAVSSLVLPFGVRALSLAALLGLLVLGGWMFVGWLDLDRDAVPVPDRLSSAPGETVGGRPEVTLIPEAGLSKRTSVPTGPVVGYARLHGRVVQLDGGVETPVVGADVRIELRPAASFDLLHLPTAPREVARRTTAADGRFAVDLHRAVVHALRVRAPGFGEHLVEQCFGGQELTVRLQPAAAVEGRVTRKIDGFSVPNVQVRIFEQNGSRYATVRTDLEGFFHIAGLQPGRRVLAVDAPIGIGAIWKHVDLVGGVTLRRDVAIELGRTYSVG